MADHILPKEAQVTASGQALDVKVDGPLEFVHEYGGNHSKPSYQEASGAPVESISPLGLQVTWFTTIFLNIGQMIGTGVFSTRESSSPSLNQFRKSLGRPRQVPANVAFLNSGHNSQRSGLCRLEYHILGPWTSHCRLPALSLYRARQLLPESFRCRSRVSRTGIPSTQIPSSYCLRCSVCLAIIQ